MNGKQIRRNFQSRGDADAERQVLEIKRLNSSRSLRATLTALTDAQIKDCEAAVHLLKDKPILEAVNFYLHNYKDATSDKTVLDALPLFLEHKEPHIGRKQYHNLRKTVTRFAACVPGKLLHEIKPVDVKGWLESIRGSKKTWNIYRTDLSTFFSWCMAKPRLWLLENPVAEIDRFTISMGIPEILAVAEVQGFMAHVENYSRNGNGQRGAGSLFFALCVFAGIRPDYTNGEMAKLAKFGLAPFVDLKNGVIRIPPEVSKIKDLRQIKIQPNLREWLLKYPPETTRLIPTSTAQEYVKIRKRFKFPHDVLRHTFISYHVAEFRSVGDTALQAGNSEHMVKKHYLNLVHEKDAEAFWKIVPESP